MRIALLLGLGLVLAGCGNKSAASLPKVDPDFDAYEKKWVADGKMTAARLRKDGRTIADKDIPTSFRTIFIGKGGVIIDRKIVATLAELDTKRPEIMAAIAANHTLAPTIGMTPNVTFDLDEQPAAVAVSVLEAFYVACKVGFYDIAVLPADKLSASPSL